MCIRINSCCGISLRKAAMVVGVFTVLETLGLIIAGGIYLYNGLKLTDVGGPSGEHRLPYRYEFIQAFGAMYLALGALWVGVSMAYIAAVWAKRPLYILPWLVLQAITIVLALINIISNASIRYFEGFGFIPVIFLYLFLYVIAFSYYLDLQEDKNNQRNRY